MQGKFMLQLDEAVNIAAGIKDRYREPAHNRCLKLHLTDGVQQLVAVEYRHCPALGLLMPAGIKLLLVNPAVRRGVLLLQPENVVLLGGVVERLEAARQALLQHIIKPAGAQLQNNYYGYTLHLC
ncbi:hypothetical protein OEZ85_005758 [Tetradesmus obliquus]|uniref:RecQ-mediated genome instability protein 1 n=1 Tax=Tetradesmus obliquus TaxID=3088 RepID=A0ABY8UES5_TETOB|nr:hypothetical protein OEZ85_005758 [Tetradesmus obliquus]